MEDIDFRAMFDGAKRALETLDAKIANLEHELERTQSERKAALQIYNATAPLVDEPLLPASTDPLLPPASISLFKTGGISVAVRSMLDTYWKEDFTPAEMRDKLAEAGWDWSNYKSPLATVHTTLMRLVESEKAKATSKEGKKAFYSGGRDGRLEMAEMDAKLAKLGASTLKEMGAYSGFAKAKEK